MDLSNQWLGWFRPQFWVQVQAVVVFSHVFFSKKIIQYVVENAVQMKISFEWISWSVYTYVHSTGSCQEIATYVIYNLI